MSFKAGFIGMVGMPNAGKSTLVNAIIGEKVGIVTSKPQTTRQRVVGIFTNDDAQIVFVDAPGLVKSDSGLNNFLQQELESVIEESDALVAVLNLDEKKPERLQQIVELTANSGKPWMAVITKRDLKLLHREEILRTMLNEYDVPVVSVSAVKNTDGLNDQILPAMSSLLPDAEAPLYDPDIYTTQNMRQISGETIREKCFELLHQEIPYGLAVRVVKYIEDQGDVVKIYAELYVSKESHRNMVVGSGGQTIKRIGQRARQEIQEMVGRRVYLDLHVKIKKNWAKQKSFMEEMGYVLPQ